MIFHLKLYLAILATIIPVCDKALSHNNSLLSKMMIVSKIIISRLTTKYCHLGSLKHLLRTYQQLIVLHSLILEPSSKIVAIIMGFGFYLMIISVSLLIYGWYILSPWVYPLIPFVCSICITILVVALPLAPLALECSESLLYRWSNMPEKFRGGRGYLKRLFKSLRSTEFICGEVGVLDGNRSTTYVASIIESSMTCLLLFGTVIKVYL